MSVPFSAAPHHDVLVVLVQLALLLAGARVFGEIAQRLRQPSVVGEILAGIVLGPSLLGSLPVLSAWLVPQGQVQGHLLELVSLLGAMFLLLITGIETDLRLIRRHARTAAGVSLGGIVCTFASGFVLGGWLPDDMRGGAASSLVFSLFVATAMSISAIPVIAKVLFDLGLMRRDVGQTILAAGMSDDTIGWILLSVVAGMATGADTSVWSVAGVVGKVAVFLIASFTVGYLAIDRLLAWVQDHAVSRDRQLSFLVVMMFAWGAITQGLGLEAVLGAFVVGILFGRMRRVTSDVVQRLESVALGIFAPIFFGTAGLKVDVRSLLEPRLVWLTLAVILVATVGKVAGTYLGARLVGRRSHWNALAFGAGLNARGAMEIIIATVGLRLGILSVQMFSVIVVMAMATSLMAPAALRFVVRRMEPDVTETERLRREEAERQSVFGAVGRVLVPTRVRTDDDADGLRFECWLLERLDPGLVLALTSVVPDASRRSAAQAWLARVRELFPHDQISTRVLVHRDVPSAILAEAEREYDLVVLGAPTTTAEARGIVLGEVVDAVLKGAACPVLVIAGTHLEEHVPPRRILVASSGSVASRNAAELAFRLAGQGADAAAVTVLHVVERKASWLHTHDDEVVRRQVAAAHDDIALLVGLGETLGVEVAGVVRTASGAEGEILAHAQDHDFDLVVLGMHVRVGAAARLYLGPRVERVLQAAPCPVVLVSTG